MMLHTGNQYVDVEALRDTVRRSLDRLGWTQTDLAAAARVDGATISRFLTGRRNTAPKTETLIRILQAVGVEPEVMLHSRNRLPYPKIMGDYALLPTVRPGGREDTSGRVIWVFTGGEELVSHPFLASRYLVAIEASDDPCMAPLIQPGDALIVDSERRHYEHREIVACLTQDDRIIARIYEVDDVGRESLVDARDGRSSLVPVRVLGALVEIRKRAATRGAALVARSA